MRNNKFINRIYFEIKETGWITLLPFIYCILIAIISPNDKGIEADSFLLNIFQVLSPIIIGISILFLVIKLYDSKTGELIQTFSKDYIYRRSTVLAFYIVCLIIFLEMSLFIILLKQSSINPFTFIYSILQVNSIVLLGIIGIKYTKELVVGVFLILTKVSIDFIGKGNMVAFFNLFIRYINEFKSLNTFMLIKLLFINTLLVAILIFKKNYK